jgi:aspartate kinase
MWRVQQIASKASSKVGEAGLNILNMDAQEETSRIIIVIEDSGNNIERAIQAIHEQRSKITFV